MLVYTITKHDDAISGDLGMFPFIFYFNITSAEQQESKMIIVPHSKTLTRKTPSSQSSPNFSFLWEVTTPWAAVSIQSVQKNL
jgi:hypothetical protein